MKNTKSNNTHTAPIAVNRISSIDIHSDVLPNMTSRQTFELMKYISQTLVFNQSISGAPTHCHVFQMRFGSMGEHSEKMVREIYSVSVYNFTTNASQVHEVEFYRAIDWSCVNISDKKIK
jgi:hypothetical protein